MKKRFLIINLCLSIVLLTTFISSIGICSLDQNVTKIAQGIIPDAGVISSSKEYKSDKVIIIFEENHASRVGQIEIALMLARLHNSYGVDTIALEGAFLKNGILDGKWFHNLTDANTREEVALQLLKEGEISGTEFIVLAIPEVEVHGIENEEEYSFDLSAVEEYPILVYLCAIAEKLFPKDNNKISEANKLVEQVQNASDKDKPAKLKELMDYLLNANEWTKERYQKLKAGDKIVSIEDMLTFLGEIKSKAKEVNANVVEYEGGYDKSIEFYNRAAERTKTIVTNTLTLFNPKKESPIALVIGAAHTDGACKMLKEQNVSYCVISPRSLNRGEDIGDLSSEAFKRKQMRLSIDDKDMIGSFLDLRWKPSPVIDQVWFRSKSELYGTATLIAHAMARGDRPPFDSLRGDLSQLKYIKIDPESFEVIENEVIFKVTAQTNDPNREQVLWVRTVMIPELANKKGKKPLEDRIKEILEKTRKEGLLLDVGLDVQSSLDRNTIPESLISKFKDNNIPLSQNATALVDEQGEKWVITDRDNDKTYKVRNSEGKLNIHKAETKSELKEVSLDTFARFEENPDVIKEVSIKHILETGG